jgi:hypothetical protein
VQGKATESFLHQLASTILLPRRLKRPGVVDWGLRYFFRENAKALRFDALIEKGYMYKPKRGPTP